MFSFDKRTGKKVDEHLHGPILAAVNKTNDQHLRKAARRRAKKMHALTDEELDRAYGKDSR